MGFVDLDGVTKAYGRKAVLAGLSLSVEHGEFFVVFGPSGTGKTSLLRVIAGMLQPDAGDVRINGRSMLGLGPEERDVAMAFQNFALYPHMTAFENIASPLRARRLPSAEVKGRVHEVASLLRIDHVLAHLPRQLSNGQKQRTSLARSLVRGPSVLLLDDPLRNVDAKIRYEMRLELPRVLRRFHSTVIYVTQDYKEAMALGDRIGVLFDGRFEQIDNPVGIYRWPKTERIARLFGDPPINVFECHALSEPGGRLSVDIGGQRLLAPRRLFGVAGRTCLVGIRPEQIEVTSEAVEGALPVELGAATPLNVRSVMLLKAADGREILATAPEDAESAFGRGHRRAWARIDLDQALFFDAASGVAL